MSGLRVRVLASGMLVLSLVLGRWGAEPAEAQTVTLKLTSPAGGPSVAVTRAVFTKDADNIGEFRGTLAVSGSATASVSFPVKASPNDLELVFIVPIDGTATVYSIDPDEFAFDKPYFLPNPSPGGVVEPKLGGLSTDPFFVISLVDVSEDNGALTSELASPEPCMIEGAI